MANPYQETKNALSYADFLDSKNGQIQQKLLFEALLDALPPPPFRVLDAASGTGWLGALLKQKNYDVLACDGSPLLVSLAKQRHPELEFSHADLLSDLPYPPGFFDAVILNMAAPDLDNLESAFKKLCGPLKTGGLLILTVPNPKLTFPVKVWKRGPLNFLLGKKPNLKDFRPYKTYKNIRRKFSGGANITSNFYTLEDYESAALSAGLTRPKITEIKSQTDSSKFDLNYQMFRYPLILMLQFVKNS